MRRADLLLSVVIVIALAGCATTPSGPPSYSARQLQEMGEKYLSAGDTANALKFLTEADRKKPGDAVIQYDLGLAYNQRQLSNKAISFLQSALKIKPDYPEALNAIGTVYAERGQIELAQEAFTKALENPFYQTPQLPAYNLGRLFEGKNDPDRALGYYQQAVKFDPNYGMAWYRIGQILENMKRGDEARHAYGKAVASAPNLAEAHLRYGVMSYQVGDMEAALFSLTRVGRIAPNTSMADEARKYLEKLKGIIQPRMRSDSTYEFSPTDVEVIGETQKKPAAKSASPVVKMQPVLNPQEPMSRLEPVRTPEPPPKPAPTPSEVPVLPAPAEAKAQPAPADQPQTGTVTVAEAPPAPTFKYIVQVGSFVDKDKAEEFKKDLQKRGYHPVIKPLKHQVLGKVFVIQLQAVNSESKATTLKTQLESDVPGGDSKILKIPVKHAEPPAANNLPSASDPTHAPGENSPPPGI